jgi:hypothetical protein
MIASPFGKRPYRQRVYLTVKPVGDTPEGEAVVILGAHLSKAAADDAAEKEPGTITRRLVVKR